MVLDQRLRAWQPETGQIKLNLKGTVIAWTPILEDIDTKEENWSLMLAMLSLRSVICPISRFPWVEILSRLFRTSPSMLRLLSVFSAIL